MVAGAAVVAAEGPMVEGGHALPGAGWAPSGCPNLLARLAGAACSGCGTLGKPSKLWKQCTLLLSSLLPSLLLLLPDALPSALPGPKSLQTLAAPADAGSPREGCALGGAQPKGSSSKREP